MRTAHRMGIMALVASGALGIIAAVVAACTVPVGPTEGTPAAGFGDAVEAHGEVVHSAEENSNCSNGDPTDLTCSYSLGVVNPDKTDGSPGGTHDPSCHYDTPQSVNPSEFDTIADATIVESTDAATVIHGEGTLDSTDDAGDPMGTGETLMCFYSNDALNNNEDGAATATVPEPFVVLE